MWPVALGQGRVHPQPQPNKSEGHILRACVFAPGHLSTENPNTMLGERAPCVQAHTLRPGFPPHFPLRASHCLPSSPARTHRGVQLAVARGDGQLDGGQLHLLPVLGVHHLGEGWGRWGRSVSPVLPCPPLQQGPPTPAHLLTTGPAAITSFSSDTRVGGAQPGRCQGESLGPGPALATKVSSQVHLMARVGEWKPGCPLSSTGSRPCAHHTPS